MTEGRISDEVRLALNHPDAVWWRNNCGAYPLPSGGMLRYGVGNPGGADLVGVFRGRAVFVEVKTPIGRLSAHQRLFRDLVERKGSVFAVVRSADDARALIADLERRFPAVLP